MGKQQAEALHIAIRAGVAQKGPAVFWLLKGGTGAGGEQQSKTLAGSAVGERGGAVIIDDVHQASSLQQEVDAGMELTDDSHGEEMIVFPGGDPAEDLGPKKIEIRLQATRSQSLTCL